MLRLGDRLPLCLQHVLLVLSRVQQDATSLRLAASSFEAQQQIERRRVTNGV